MARLNLSEDQIPHLPAQRSLRKSASPTKTNDPRKGKSDPSDDSLRDGKSVRASRRATAGSEKRVTMRRLGSRDVATAIQKEEERCNESEARTYGNQQRPLKIAHVNSLLLPLSKVANGKGAEKPKHVDTNSYISQPSNVRDTPKRATREKKVDYSRLTRWEEGSSDAEGLSGIGEEDEDDEFTDLSGFIVSDGDEDIREGEEKTKPRKSKSGPLGGMRNENGVANKTGSGKLDFSRGAPSIQRSLDETFKSLRIRDSEPDVVDLTSPPKLQPRLQPFIQVEKENTSPSKPSTTSIWHSDPFISSPTKNVTQPATLPSDTVGFITPPNSPSKPRLKSPTKINANRIPQSPHRPSIDAFWSQEVINDWNDEYSPKKTIPQTPGARRIGKFLLDSDTEGSSGQDNSPSTSPRKAGRSPANNSPIKSPTKKQEREEKKALVARKKAFDEKKDGLARSFLKELDERIANGQVATLSASTGGVKVVWSKKLNSTAGRANWKREVVRIKRTSANADGDEAMKDTAEPIVRHYASIELAEKVIDDEDRLLNTLAHEYCHLANFMISGVKNNPHGASFKTWAEKATKAFSTIPGSISSSIPPSATIKINVTTKHSYTISYKYAWCCKECCTDYQRHSKSIDPTKHRCGGCKGSLVQVRPKPRKGNPNAGFGRKEKGDGGGSGEKKDDIGDKDGELGIVTQKMKEIEVVDLLDD